MITFEAFQAALGQAQCPESFGPHLQALWYDHKGEWNRAHRIVQALSDRDAARIHAYLHRKEGDEGNSRYWHARAGSVFPSGMSFEEEWRQLVEQLSAGAR